MPVTVDLPLVPPTAIPVSAALNRRASSSARVIRSSAEAAGGLDVGHGLLDRGRGDEDLVRTGQAAAVLREKRDAAAAQKVELGGGPALVERAVGAGDLGALAVDDRGQRQHAAAADAAEEIGFGP